MSLNIKAWICSILFNNNFEICVEVHNFTEMIILNIYIILIYKYYFVNINLDHTKDWSKYWLKNNFRCAHVVNDFRMMVILMKMHSIIIYYYLITKQKFIKLNLLLII